MTNLPPLSYTDLDGVRLQLNKDLDFMGVHVPAGFICDGQSWVIGEKRAARAAFVHDWLYYHNGNIPGVEQKYSKAKADALFRRGLIASGVPRIVAWTRWAALKIVGWRAWGKHKERIKNEKASSPYSVGACE